mgnify:CR=1 FL=1
MLMKKDLLTLIDSIDESFVVMLIVPLIRFPFAFKKLKAVLEDSFASRSEPIPVRSNFPFPGSICDSRRNTPIIPDLPCPTEMGTDTAFLDRMHCYIPGWEIPKFRPEHFTDDYGFITDYLAEFMRELRKEQYGDALDRYYRLGKNLNQRDTIAVRKIVGGAGCHVVFHDLNAIFVFEVDTCNLVKGHTIP